MLSIQFSLLRKNTRGFLMYYYRQNSWRHRLTLRLGGKHMSGQTTLQSLLVALSFSRSGKWSALAFRTSVQSDYWWQGPRDLPACTSLFWTADPNTLCLLEWHVTAILKGDPLLRLWCVHHCVQSRRAILGALCFPFRLRFFYSGKRFLKWGRQKTDLHGLDRSPATGAVL